MVRTHIKSQPVAGFARIQPVRTKTEPGEIVQSAVRGQHTGPSFRAGNAIPGIRRSPVNGALYSASRSASPGVNAGPTTDVQCKPSSRGGFTLIEMIVAVGVVLLMMMLFAQIFEMAAGAISQMKGMAKNDQKVRTITLLMKEDLDHRTFRRIYPFAPRQNTNNFGPFFSPQQRQGYFSISENDPTDPTDDVLAFTARFPDPVAGRATIDPNVGTATANQPEFDDGNFANGIGLSRAVEIVYFLRHGNLYRQVHLIRDPYDDSNVPPPSLNGSGNYPLFWRDFDYSAFRIYDGTPSLRLHDIETAPDNSFPSSNGIIPWDHDSNPGTLPIQLPPSLGIPHLRFGHSLTRGNGTPREHVGGAFIGRFLLQEAANSQFFYPGTGTPAQDPHLNNTLGYNPNTGRVTPFDNQIFRRGEDILLTNVHEFDIKVWDDYQEIDYIRDGSPPVNEDGSNDLIFDLGEDANGNNIFEIEDYNRNGTFDSVLQFVDLGHNLAAADGSPIGYYNAQPFPIAAAGQNGVIGPFGRLNLNTAPGIQGNRYDTWHPFHHNAGNFNVPPPFGQPAYRPIQLFGNDRVPGTPDNDDPADDPIVNDSGVIRTFGLITGVGEEGWLGSDDEAPLQAIQITIRFYDVKSDQMQQLTLVHSLKE